MKKVLAILFCAFFAIALTAQERSGSIAGTVNDAEGNPLPGVSLTLTGQTIAPMAIQSNAEGKFRFLSLFPANDYVIKAELQGFKTKTETGIIVNVGRNSDIVISLEQGGLEEEVTVVAKTPIVQAKKTQITHTVSLEMLQSLPSARDPWVVLQMTPGVQMDRENVGGTESGQQSYYFAKGSNTQEWTMDGMQITDRNSGGSPGYYDFDMFEELNISTGTLDVEHRNPGVTVNIVTRRGGNKLSLGARFFYTDEKFQSTISQAKLDDIGLTRGYNHALDIKDFGFNAGGPFVKDKAWWWFGYGVQQVLTLNAVNTRDDTYLNNYTAKLNFQLIPSNRLEVLYMLGDKKKFGRSAGPNFPSGWNQGSKFHFGNPTWKIQDEQMVGNDLFLSVRFGKSNPGFGMRPAIDMDLEKVAWQNIDEDMWHDSQTYFYSNRPHPYAVFQAQYFNDNLFGTAHEIKVGFELNPNSRTYEGGYPGNVHYHNSYYYENINWNGDGDLDADDIVYNNPNYLDDNDDPLNLAYVSIGQNDYPWSDGTKRWAAYFSDVITAGRFNINLGVRFDRSYNFVDPWTTRGLFAANGAGNFAHYADIARQVFTEDAVTELISMLGDMSSPNLIKPPKTFTTFSPRVGLTYDVFGDGRTIAKASYTLYPGTGLGTVYTQPFGMFGFANFWAADQNGDSVYGLNELYWVDPNSSLQTPYRVFTDEGVFVGNTARELGTYWGGCNALYSDETSESVTSVDTNTWKYTLTHEFNASIEREIFKDFGVSLGFTYKKTGRFSQIDQWYPASAFPTLSDLNHIRNADDYVLAGTIPDTIISVGADGVFGTADDISYDPGAAAGKSWYVLVNADYTGPSSYRLMHMLDSKRFDEFMGGELVFTKRLSNKWMANAAFTLQTQKRHYGRYGYWESARVPNPTNLWAVEGQQYGFTFGSLSGKIDRDYFSRWTVQLSGLYQLPWDVSVSATLSAHEGTFVATLFSFEDRTLTGVRNYSVTMPTTTMNDRDRVPNVYNVSAKIEKMLKLGDTGRLFFSLDFFNVPNLHTVVRQYDQRYGTFRYEGETPFRWTAPLDTAGKIYEILNPFVYRLGMRFQF